MPNDFSHLTSTQALKASKAVTTVVPAAPNAYGFTTAQINGLTVETSALSDALDAQHAAEMAAVAATDLKNQALASLRVALIALAKSADANPAITDDMLKAIGFAPRRAGGSKPRVLAPPTGLAVTPLASGQAKLAWSRSPATLSSTVFTVWKSADGLDFSILGAVTRASFLVEDAPAGVAAWYRVTASRGSVTSPPSMAVSTYAPTVAAESPRLRVA